MNRDRYLIFLSVLYFAILGCFLLGCSEGTDSSPVSALMGNINSSTSNNKIKGVVLETTTNTPMGDVYVQLYDVNNHFVKGELTGVDGTYTFSGIDNGTYTININYEGYEFISPTPTYCNVTNGVTYPENYVLFLKYLSSSSTSDEVFATIKGNVKRSDNSSAANMPITLCSDKDGNSKVGNFESLVLGDGSFTFFNVPAGKNYFLRVGDTNSAEKTVYPIGIDNDGIVSPTQISITVNVVTQASTISSVVFKVASAYTGATLELATVQINGENIGTTNINGEIIINNLATGLSNIEITKEGFESLISSKNFSLSDNGSTISFTMIEDTKDGYGSITGRYVDIDSSNGVGNLYVRLYRMIKRVQTNTTNTKPETWYDVDKNFILTTRTSNGTDSNGLEGSFKLTHIEPGCYQIYIGSTPDIPETELRSQVYPDYEWIQLKTNTPGHIVITQPFEVVSDQTTYWTNYEQGNN